MTDCVIPKCGRRVVSRGLCQAHYLAARRAGVIDKFPVRDRRADTEVEVEAYLAGRDSP